MNARPTKTDALVRDIAKLFVTYSPSVWRPVLDDLSRGGGAYAAVAGRIEELLAQASSVEPKPRTARARTARRGPAKARMQPGATQMNLEFSPDRRDTLEALGDALTRRRLLPSAADIRHVYLESGGKGDLPKARKAAIDHLLRHLDGIPEASFRSVHEAVQQHGPAQDAAGDYQRWFHLIRKP